LSNPVYELEQVFVVQDKKLIVVVACQSGDMRRTRNRRESDLHYGGWYDVHRVSEQEGLGE
jgi:hypothetical protein